MPCPNQFDPDFGGACCCNCKHRVEDFWHCTTHPVRESRECRCSEPKGWICLGEWIQGGNAHSGWSEHGLCEMHDYTELYLNSTAHAGA